MKTTFKTLRHVVNLLQLNFFFCSLTKPQNKMKTSDKQILRVFVVITLMPLIVAALGTAMNYLFSCVFMCSFSSVQLSAIWIFHTLMGIFFTVALLIDNHG